MDKTLYLSYPGKKYKQPLKELVSKYIKKHTSRKQSKILEVRVDDIKQGDNYIQLKMKHEQPSKLFRRLLRALDNVRHYNRIPMLVQALVTNGFDLSRKNQEKLINKYLIHG